MPEHISRNAYLRLWEFLDTVHDMDISFEEMDDDLPTWGFDEIPEDEYEKGTEDIAHGDD